MYGTILFDLDGTLTDPFIGITGGVMYALERLGREVPPREELKSFIGPPLIDEFCRRFSMEQSCAEQAAKLYREYYTDRGMFENQLIDGAVELLERVKGSGRTVCLATCKPDLAAKAILEHFGILKFFDIVGAATLDGRIKTKAQVLESVLRSTGAAPSDCVLVGDRLYDVVGAHEVGMRCIGVLTGYGSREELRDSGADVIVSSLSEVMDHI